MPHTGFACTGKNVSDGKPQKCCRIDSFQRSEAAMVILEHVQTYLYQQFKVKNKKSSPFPRFTQKAELSPKSSLLFSRTSLSSGFRTPGCGCSWTARRVECGGNCVCQCSHGACRDGDTAKPNPRQPESNASNHPSPRRQRGWVRGWIGHQGGGKQRQILALSYHAQGIIKAIF